MRYKLLRKQYLNKLPDKISIPNICTETIKNIRPSAKILIAQQCQSNSIGKWECKPICAWPWINARHKGMRILSENLKIGKCGRDYICKMRVSSAKSSMGIVTEFIFKIKSPRRQIGAEFILGKVSCSDRATVPVAQKQGTWPLKDQIHEGQAV